MHINEGLTEDEYDMLRQFVSPKTNKMNNLKTQEVQMPEEIEMYAEAFAENNSEIVRNVYEYNTANDVMTGFIGGVIWQQTLNTDKYPLTKEQIIKLVGDAFAAG